MQWSVDSGLWLVDSMIAILISLPLLSGLVMFQSAVVSRTPLLHGTADLIMLTLIAWALQERVTTAWFWSAAGGLLASLTSGLPFGILLGGYLAITGSALLLRRRVWQAPVLAMFLTTFLGTMFIHGLSLLVVSLNGAELTLIDSLDLVTLPSLLLNLLLAIPVYALVGDLANWLYPKEIEV